MIVIPERCCLLLVWIVVDRGLPRRKPFFRQPVALRRGAGTVKMRNGSDRGCRHGSMNVRINREEMLPRKLVPPFHLNGLSPHRLKDRPGILSLVTPEERRRQ